MGIAGSEFGNWRIREFVKIVEDVETVEADHLAHSLMENMIHTFDVSATRVVRRRVSADNVSGRLLFTAYRLPLTVLRLTGN